MLCAAVMVIFGLIALAKGEFKVTGNRKVSGNIGRILGILLLVGAGAGFLFGEFGGLVQIIAFLFVVVVGLITSEKIEKTTTSSTPTLSTKNVENKDALSASGPTKKDLEIGIYHGFYIFDSDKISNEVTNTSYGAYAESALLRALSKATEPEGGLSTLVSPMPACHGDLFERSMMGEKPGVQVLGNWIKTGVHGIDVTQLEPTTVSKLKSSQSLGYIPYVVGISTHKFQILRTHQELKARNIIGYNGIVTLDVTAPLFPQVASELHLPANLEIRDSKCSGWLVNDEVLGEIGAVVEGVRKGNSTSLPERIITAEHAKTVIERAGEFYDSGNYHAAIPLYDRLLSETPSGIVNQYKVKEFRAIAYCKTGQFDKAQRDLQELFEVIVRQGGSIKNSTAWYWYLVTTHGGDEDTALNDFTAMSDEEMIKVLSQLCDAYMQNDKTTISELEPQAREIGEILDQLGGMQEMLRVFNLLNGRPGSRTLEMHWGGIGDWRM